MKNEIKAAIPAYLDETIARIQQAVKINSVKVQNPNDGTIYGQGIANSLNDFVKQAQEVGLTTFLDPNGRYAFAD